MRGQPVEMSGAVMNFVETPQKIDFVLQTVSPIDQKIAQQYYFQSLEPERLRLNEVSKSDWYQLINPLVEISEQSQYEPVPEQVLALEITEVEYPALSENCLPLFCRKCFFQWYKHQRQEKKTCSGPN